MRPRKLADLRGETRNVEKSMRAIAIVTILGLLALALIPLRGEAGGAHADQLQWQASWE